MFAKAGAGTHQQEFISARREMHKHGRGVRGTQVHSRNPPTAPLPSVGLLRSRHVYSVVFPTSSGDALCFHVSSTSLRANYGGAPSNFWSSPELPLIAFHSRSSLFEKITMNHLINWWRSVAKRAMRASYSQNCYSLCNTIKGRCVRIDFFLGSLLL